MPKTLLLADDSLTIRRLVELTFAEEDVTVTSVGDGRRAMAHIASLHPDIVLADAAMSPPDGYDVATFVKGTPQLAHIPVILLTAAFQPIDEARAKASGCEAVLAKPFELTLLVGRVKELLRAAETKAANAAEAQAGDAAEATRGEAARSEVVGGAGVPPAVDEPAPDGAPVPPGAERSLEDLFDAIDANCSQPAGGTLPLLDARLLPFVPPWDRAPGPGADGGGRSLDAYFDLVDEVMRRGQGGLLGVPANAASALAPAEAAGAHTPDPTSQATSLDGRHATPGATREDPARRAPLGGVAGIFLSLLESSAVPASPQHVERALRWLLGDD